MLTALAAVGALYFNTHQTSEALQATRDQVGLSEQGQLTDRFSKAVEQLGTKDSLEVRLGGIYALERIARDSARDHPTVMEVLSAYVREHAPLSMCSSTAPSARPTTDVQAILTVLGRRDKTRDHDAPLLNGTCLTYANLSGADLTNVNLTNANLTNANLTNAHLSRVNLSTADLTKANLSTADLTNAELTNANLTKANLSTANLSTANLVFAHLSNANLSLAHLSNAYLSGADLITANLAYADLTHAYLSGAYLSGADLTGADLTHADLTGADLTHADLTDADLAYADLTGADLSDTRGLPGSPKAQPSPTPTTMPGR